MNTYEKTYTILKDNINESRETIEYVTKELTLTREKLGEIETKISNKKYNLNILRSDRHQILSRNDKLISVPITLLTIIVEIALIYAGYNIAMIPQNILSKIIAGLLVFSLDGATCIAVAIAANMLTSKIEKILHKKIQKNNTEYRELSNEITKEKDNLQVLKQEENNLKNKIDALSSKISQEKQLIGQSAKDLQQLKNEMIELVFEEQQENIESLKAYARVKKNTR